LTYFMFSLWRYQSKQVILLRMSSSVEADTQWWELATSALLP